MKNLTAVACGILLCALPHPACAKIFGELGGFDVQANESDAETPNSGSCIMMNEYEGPGDTQLVITRYLNNPDIVVVTSLNYNWSTKNDQKYKLRYEIDDFYYERETMGFSYGGKKGFMAGFPSDDFLPTFASGTTFRIFKDDSTVDRLSLTNSAAAVAGFNRCWQYLKADEALKQKERNRFKGIEKDPFKE